jgi:hypothetical protein
MIFQVDFKLILNDERQAMLQKGTDLSSMLTVTITD